MATNYTPITWSQALLSRLGMPQTRSNVQAILGWVRAEGGHWNNTARFNPLNTTMPAPGAGNTGTQGNIKVYTSWQQGLDATVRTLRNGLYKGILGALKRGNNPNAVGSAITNSQWGTGGLAAQVISQTKLPGSLPTAPSGGGLAHTASAGARSPGTTTTTTTSSVAPDTSLMAAIQALSSSQAQPRTPIAPASFNPGGKYSVPAPFGAITPPAPAASSDLSSQLSGLADLVGPSAVSRTTTKPVARTPKAATGPAKGPAPTTGGGVLPKGHSDLFELIHNTGSGPGFGVKNGQIVNGSQVFSGVWAGHRDHVHVAAGPNTIVDVGKLAQSMGLHVGENPHFGGVHPVHVPGSYHYKGEAIDVSGPDALMNQFATRVEQIFGLRGRR